MGPNKEDLGTLIMRAQAALDAKTGVQVLRHRDINPGDYGRVLRALTTNIDAATATVTAANIVTIDEADIWKWLQAQNARITAMP